jgi:hypothetical protein
MSTLEFESAPVKYIQIAGLGCALAPVEFANSSDHTSVPDGMFTANAWLVTLLAESPAVCAIALTVRFEATRNGAA